MKLPYVYKRRRTINPERAKRYLLRDVPDHLDMSYPRTTEQEVIHRAKVERWIRRWGQAHNVREPMIYRSTSRQGVHYTISEN